MRVFSQVIFLLLCKISNRFNNLAPSKAILITSVLIISGVIGVNKTGILEFIDLVIFDQYVRLQPDKGHDPRLLVVGITETDIKLQNQWPISDQTLAKALENLQRYRPKAIGIDIHRNLSHPPGSKALLQQLQRSNVIVIYQIGDSTHEGTPPPSQIPERQIGFNDLVVDSDGVVRRNFMYAKAGPQEYYSFALRCSLQYLGAGTPFQVDEDRLRIGSAIFPRLSSDAGAYHAIDSLGYQVLGQYRSSEQPVRQVTLTQILNGAVEPAWITDQVVLIGTTAPSIKDLLLTPYSASRRDNPYIPGVLIHAQFISQILNTVLDQQRLFWFWSDPWEIVWTCGWAVLGGFFAWRIAHPAILAVTGVALLGSLFSACFLAFLQSGWIPIVSPAIALLSTGGSILAYKILHHTLYDELTGLPNRRLMLERIQKMLAQRQHFQQLDTLSTTTLSFAVLFLDLDSFKIINEGWGHQLGDQLLIDVSKRLQKSLPKSGFLSRVGGDEFVVLLQQIQDKQDVTNFVDQLQQKFTAPFLISNQKLFISFGIGIALGQSDQDYQPENLLRDAHTAMYRAKDMGKARHEVFASGMHTQVVERLQLENDLRLAVAQAEATGISHELFLHYQPIISLESERIVGFEALARWKHSQHGFISPLKFISIAEENGLIIPLGQWILKEACRQLKTWQTQFPNLPPLTVSVNLSGQQFNQPDLVEFVNQTLKTTGLDGNSLKLEITETVAMRDVEAAINLLLRLRALNIRLSIDDFGTGYSSLSYLHRFPINTLKIDRSFVSRMLNTDADAAIAQTIITLGHKLGMDIVAEGIETSEQALELKVLKCEYGQGYFFFKPLDSKAIERLLAQEEDKLNLL